MAVPKKRTGHSAQGKRRSNWKATKPTTTKCPNCGAEIKKGVDTCEFCRSKITKESDEWLLARKRSTV